MDAAQLNCIAGYYESGHLVRRNLPSAFELYQKGAEMGDAEAEYNLAECYYNGSGTQKDPVQAVFWFKMAERHGYAAAGELSALYEKDLTPDQLTSVLQELDLKSAPTANDQRKAK
jgi:TPR repeat protein